MDSKLEELLNTIKFPEEEYSSFFNVSLKRVKVNKEKMRIILDSEIPLKLSVYLKLNELLNSFFNTDCVIEVNTIKEDLSNLRECYNYAVSFRHILFHFPQEQHFQLYSGEKGEYNYCDVLFV